MSPKFADKLFRSGWPDLQGNRKHQNTSGMGGGGIYSGWRGDFFEFVNILNQAER